MRTGGTPISGQDWGYPNPAEEGDTTSQVRIGVLTLSAGWWGYPPPPNRQYGSQVRMRGSPPTETAYCVLNMWQVVCLLHSHRRTFLLLKLKMTYIVINLNIASVWMIKIDISQRHSLIRLMLLSHIFCFYNLFHIY